MIAKMLDSVSEYLLYARALLSALQTLPGLILLKSFQYVGGRGGSLGKCHAIVITVLKILKRKLTFQSSDFLG